MADPTGRRSRYCRWDRGAFGGYRGERAARPDPTRDGRLIGLVSGIVRRCHVGPRDRRDDLLLVPYGRSLWLICKEIAGPKAPLFGSGLPGRAGVATNGSVGAKPLQSAPGPAGLGHRRGSTRGPRLLRSIFSQPAGRAVMWQRCRHRVTGVWRSDTARHRTPCRSPTTPGR